MKPNDIFQTIISHSIAFLGGGFIIFLACVFFFGIRERESEKRLSQDRAAFQELSNLHTAAINDNQKLGNTNIELRKIDRDRDKEFSKLQKQYNYYYAEYTKQQQQTEKYLDNTKRINNQSKNIAGSIYEEVNEFRKDVQEFKEKYIDE